MKRIRIIALILSIVIIISVLNILSLKLTIIFFTSETFYSLLPYDKVNHWLLYDHIEYNGVDYYCYDPDLRPYDVIPDFSREISISIVNSECEPYDKNRFETAYLCQNDDNNIYIYYGSCYFVSDKSLTSEYSK